jgi:hypothetical protein
MELLRFIIICWLDFLIQLLLVLVIDLNWRLACFGLLVEIHKALTVGKGDNEFKLTYSSSFLNNVCASIINVYLGRKVN